MNESNMIIWHDFQECADRGKEWKNTVKYFDRLSANAQNIVPEKVWNLSRYATGIASLFESNTSEIH